MLIRIFSRRWILTTMLVIAGAGVCARLGIWQLDRLRQRRAFNSHVYAMRAMPALDLNQPSGADLASMEYREASATGTYDFGHEVGIRNQSNDGQYGYHLLTPLLLAGGKAVLVDRGWIPYEGNSEPAAWRKYAVPPTALIRGIIRDSQTTAGFGGITDPTLTPGQEGLELWIYVNIQRIGQQLPYPVLPVYVQLDPDPSRTNPPIPFQAELDLTEGPHQGYAIQWFSFATILLAGYPFYIRKQENPKK